MMQPFKYNFWPQLGTGMNMYTGTKEPTTFSNQQRFPWFSEEDVKKLEDMTKDIQNQNERLNVQNELYRKFLPVVENRNNMIQRDVEINNLTYQVNTTTDKNQKWEISLQLKMGTLGSAIKRKYWIPSTEPDDKTISDFSKKITWWEQMLLDYINWKNDNILKMASEEAKEKNIFRDIVAWAGKWSRMLPEFLLDTAAKRSKKQIEGRAKKWFLPEEQAQEAIGKVSSMVEWIKSQSDIWEDKTSIAYKAAKTTSEVAQIAEWWLALVKWIQWLRAASAIRRTQEAKTVLKNAKDWKEILENKTLRKMWEAIQPKMTPKKRWDVWGRILKSSDWAVIWRTEPTFFKKQQTLPTKSDISRLRTAFDAGIDYTKPIETQATQIAKYIEKQAKMADNLLSKKGSTFSKKIFNKKTFETHLNKIEEAPSDISDTNKEKIKNIFMKYLKKYDPTSMNKAKQDFSKDNTIKQILDWPANDKQEYVKAINNSVKSFIEKHVPWYSKIIKEEANAYSILKNQATKFKDKGKFKQFVSDNKEIIKALVYMWWGGYAVSLLAGKAWK